MYKEKPECPKCRTDKNVVRYATYFKCCFCGKIVRGEIGQTELQSWGVT